MLKKLFLIVLICVFIAPANVFAGSFHFEKGDFYASVNAGYTILNDIDFGSNLNTQGITVNAAGTSTYDGGFSISGTAGYTINKWARAEFELGYAEFDHDKVNLSVSGSITSGGTTTAVNGSADIDIKGEVETLSGQGSVLFTPFGTIAAGDGLITPLFGGGIGFVNWKDTVDSYSVGGVTTTLNSSVSHTDAIYNMTAGLEFSNIKNWFIGVRYRHMWVDTGKNGYEDATVDNFMGTYTYRF